nr:MAG TPA: hypothetical protein [Caudoviricetes sp.]
MSETSTNAVQNKVIDAAIKNHKINNDNVDFIPSYMEGGIKILTYAEDFDIIGHTDNSGACYLITSSTSSIPKIYYSANGTSHDSQLLRDIDMVALTDTELTKILV